MKIYIGSKNSCNLNYQHDLIFNQLSNFFEITKDVSEADVIVVSETCCCTEYNLKRTLYYIDSILKRKKDDAKVYLTGCISRPFKDNKFLSEVENWLKEHIDFIIPQNQPNLLLKLISNEVFSDLNLNNFGMVGFTPNNSACLYISNGCLNKCSFCKVTYQDYPLKSVDFNELKDNIDRLDEKGYSEIFLIGTNICQYGLDKNGKYMLPEVIEYLNKKEGIKKVRLIGFAFKDAINNDFESVIANSSKVVEISGALESGSNRLLELIRKGFNSEEIINFVHNIRKKYYKYLYLNIIAGFPTESLDDVRQTLEVLKELDPYMIAICRYVNSRFVESNNYEQLMPNIIQEHARIYSRVLQKRNVQVKIVNKGYKYN